MARKMRHITKGERGRRDGHILDYIARFADDRLSHIEPLFIVAGLVEQADTEGLNPSAEGRSGSSPLSGTTA